MRIKLQDYKITQSLKRDEQAMNLTLKVDYNLDIPGKKDCSYDESWKYICNSGSGTHISGYTSAKIAFSQF